MHPIAHIIAKFGATIGMDGLETENGVCTLRFDDVTVTLECAENDGALYLYSRVCGLPESDADKLALYGLLLELDSFFKGTDGAPARRRDLYPPPAAGTSGREPPRPPGRPSCGYGGSAARFHRTTAGAGPHAPGRRGNGLERWHAEDLNAAAIKDSP